MATGEIRNPNIEIRNKFEIQNQNEQNENDTVNCDAKYGDPEAGFGAKQEGNLVKQNRDGT